MLKELYAKKGLMQIWDESKIDWSTRRKEIAKILLEQEYGKMPRMHDDLSWELISCDNKFCAGKATMSKVVLTAKFGDEECSFPIKVAVPKKDGKLPFFVYLSFSGDLAHKYYPAEEICDRGFAVISFDYQDVAVDEVHVKTNDSKYKDDLYKLLFKDKSPANDHCGKIRLWAWAASRAMDYAQTLDNLDFEKSAVLGHSRLGKTALVAGMLDERFAYVISNDSGCSGASISRDKGGEDIDYITTTFPYWFCKNYTKYSKNESNMPFDQHFLLASIAPRKVYVSSAKEDLWADPDGEFLSCFAASEVYEKLGISGFVCPDRMPVPGDVFAEGNIAYHQRFGTHYLSREDWNLFMDYILK